MKKSLLCRLLLTCPLIWASASIFANEMPDWKQQTLTGDWDGARERLYNKGINWGFTHKSDVYSNVSGGIKEGTKWMGHTEARLNLDLDKLTGLSDTEAYVVYHSQLGSKFNRDHVGSFSGVSNIETNVNTGKFFHAWVQKRFSDGQFSLLAGLYPIDSEFYVTETSGLFLQPPYGISNEIAQTGKNGPSIFATSSLGLRLKYNSAQGFYVQSSVNDAVPGHPSNPRGTHIQLNDGDGSYTMFEMGYMPKSDEIHKTALGFWRYSNRFDDLIDVDNNGSPLRRISRGVYAIAEHSFNKSSAGFVRFGTASSDVHMVDWTGSLGIRSNSFIEGRQDDVMGVAVTFNHASNKYRLLNNAEKYQNNLEFSYRAQVNPWFALQPSIQHIQNPNMDPTIDKAWMTAVRAEVNF